MFQDWGQKLLKWAFEKWIELRKKEKEELITKVGGFDDWLKGRQESEQRVARRLVKILVDDDAINTDQARPLLEIVKGSVETIAFRELVETLEEETPSAAALIKLFDEWRVIEAREYLQLGDGRISAINQLEKYINRGALEVKEIQPLLTNNLWLLNMRWNEASEQKTYSKLLRENCKEPKELEEENRRIDIVGITEGGRMTIVEIKRPEKTLNRKDLEQIAQYVDWARANIMGTGPDAPRQISGLLIVGKLSDKGDVGEQISRLAGSDIRVEIYRDLYEAARKEYKEVERRLEKIAPEYTRSRRKRKKLGKK
jgi:hypothetical protein